MECFDKCMRCQERKQFKMPDYCSRFVKDTLEARMELKTGKDCSKCKYVKFYAKIKNLDLE